VGEKINFQVNLKCRNDWNLEKLPYSWYQDSWEGFSGGSKNLGGVSLEIKINFFISPKESKVLCPFNKGSLKMRFQKFFWPFNFEILWKKWLNFIFQFLFSKNPILISYIYFILQSHEREENLNFWCDKNIF